MATAPVPEPKPKPRPPTDTAKLKSAKKRAIIKGKIKSKGKPERVAEEKYTLGGADYVTLLLGGRRKAAEEAMMLPPPEP